VTSVDPTENHPNDGPFDLGRLVERARGLAESGDRRILGIAGTPGSGKSTISAALLDALGSDAVLVGMDGFHLGSTELARLGRQARKGAPDTFDTDGYVALLGRLRAQRRRDADIYAPVFDRSLEEPVGSSVPVASEVPLVITEGNYLLLEHGGWEGVRPMMHETWFIDVDADERHRRLVARRLSYGHPAIEAEAWVTDVDEPNAAVIETTRDRADLVLTFSTAPAAATP
jgi:pantothenate kinase